MKSHVAMISILGAGAALGSGCSGDAGAQAIAPREVIAVKVAAVSRADAAPPIRTAGVLTGKRELKLAFKVGGLVQRLLAEEGATVKKGQLLAALVHTEIDAQVSQAERAFEKSERDLARVKVLHEKNATTLGQLQDATTGFEMTRAQLDAARFNRQHASIIAPEGGRVLRRFTEEGEMVAPGTPILLFAASGKGWVVHAGLADRDVVRVRIGDPAQVRFAAHPGVVFTAEVSEIAAASSALTGTFDVELRIVDSPAEPLLSGMSAQIEIAPSSKQRVTFIPIEAFVEGDGDRGTVYVVQGEAAKKVPVRAAFIDGQRVAIREGLDEIAAVITDGAAYLSDGAPLKVVE